MGQEIIIKPASPSHSDPANKLIYSTGDYFFDYLFSYEQEKIFQLLKILFEKNKGIFSHKFAEVAEFDGKIVGLEVGYALKDKKVHQFFNDAYIIKRHNPIQVAKMIYRNYQIDKFIKKLQPDSYYIANLAVMPEMQGKGIGGMLLENAFKKAKLKNYNNCFLDVSINNKLAIKFYEKYGFKIFKEIRNPKTEDKHGLHGQYRLIKKL
ncbi:MAG TPA: GNAT family N-acetyltransferase [bacterium]|nr:GNAT family N-acetyltransferase [bacterium]HNS33943.1 GNAT family N-acetyltransferase [bacterium]